MLRGRDCEGKTCGGGVRVSVEEWGRTEALWRATGGCGVARGVEGKVWLE